MADVKEIMFGKKKDGKDMEGVAFARMLFKGLCKNIKEPITEDHLKELKELRELVAKSKDPDRKTLLEMLDAGEKTANVGMLELAIGITRACFTCKDAREKAELLGRIEKHIEVCKGW